MTVYMVERDLPGITLEQLGGAQKAAIDTSPAFTAQGKAVRYIRSTYVPGEARVMCLFLDALRVRRLDGALLLAAVPSAALAALGVVAALFLPEIPLRGTIQDHPPAETCQPPASRMRRAAALRSSCARKGLRIRALAAVASSELPLTTRIGIAAVFGLERRRSMNSSPSIVGIMTSVIPPNAAANGSCTRRRLVRGPLTRVLWELMSDDPPPGQLLTATLDSNVVIYAINRTRAAAVALLACGMAGRIDLAVTTREPPEQKSIPTGDFALYLGSLPVLTSPFVWGTSSWGEDVWGPSSYQRPTQDAIDADHIEAHRMSGRNYFVTGDSDALKRAKRQGVAACTPEAMLEILGRVEARHRRP